MITLRRIITFFSILSSPLVFGDFNKAFPDIGDLAYEDLITIDSTRIDSITYNLIFPYDIFYMFEHRGDFDKHLETVDLIERILREKGLVGLNRHNQNNFRSFRYPKEKFHLSVNPKKIASALKIFQEEVYRNHQVPPFDFKVTDIQKCSMNLEYLKMEIQQIKDKLRSESLSSKKQSENKELLKTKTHYYDSTERLCSGNQFTIYPVLPSNHINEVTITGKEGGALFPIRVKREIKAILKRITARLEKAQIMPGRLSPTDSTVIRPYITARKFYDDNGIGISSTGFFLDRRQYYNAIKGQDLLPLIKYVKK